MRIVAGAWRGRTLVAPSGQGTRPTADRVRQALFDMLMHAGWGGRSAIEGAAVLDVFAGTGALGLEALSRGAANACFIESDPAALKALRANVAACKAVDRVRVVASDALDVPVFVSRPGLSGLPFFAAPTDTVGPDKRGLDGDRTRRRHDFSLATTYLYSPGSKPGHDEGIGRGASLVFLDPPYGQDLVPRAVAHLLRTGYIAPGALIVAETGQHELWLPDQPLLAERRHGAARVLVFRVPEDCN
jgi:16S rRNA (guanine966-N2)-methyltransferase